MKVSRLKTDRIWFIVILLLAAGVNAVIASDPAVHWSIWATVLVAIAAGVNRFLQIQQPKISIILTLLILAAIVSIAILTNGARCGRVAAPEICLYSLASYRIASRESIVQRPRNWAMEMWCLAGFAIGTVLIYAVTKHQP